MEDNLYNAAEVKHIEHAQKRLKSNRAQNIVWFNPAFSRNMRTDLVKRFLKLIDYVKVLLLKSEDCNSNTNFTKNGKMTTVYYN